MTGSADCDDSDRLSYPGAVETCDSADNDCNGAVDDGAVDASTWYIDGDGDGFGGAATVLSCTQPAGYAALDGDCDDADTLYYPGAPESCSAVQDYNCDGSVGYADADGDGFVACNDCDDGDPASYPGAVELCDGADNDCDGAIDDGAIGGPMVRRRGQRRLRGYRQHPPVLFGACGLCRDRHGLRRRGRADLSGRGRVLRRAGQRL